MSKRKPPKVLDVDEFFSKVNDVDEYYEKMKDTAGEVQEIAKTDFRASFRAARGLGPKRPASRIGERLHETQDRKPPQTSQELRDARTRHHNQPDGSSGHRGKQSSSSAQRGTLNVSQVSNSQI